MVDLFMNDTVYNIRWPMELLGPVASAVEDDIDASI